MVYLFVNPLNPVAGEWYFASVGYPLFPEKAFISPLCVPSNGWRYCSEILSDIGAGSVPVSFFNQAMKMYTQYAQWLPVSFIALWLLAASSGASGHEVAKHQIEAGQKVEIARILARSDFLYGNEIRIAVYEGNVTLLGKVETAVNRDLAKQIALGVDGINSVDNRIVVDAAYRSPQLASQRSYTEMAAQMKSAAENEAMLEVQRDIGATDNSEQNGWSADTWVTLRVKFAFLYSATIDSGNISVSTNNGIVTLNGRAASGAERALAIEQAGNVRGVKAVDAAAFKADSEDSLAAS